jgi:hypothetical protein
MQLEVGEFVFRADRAAARDFEMAICYIPTRLAAAAALPFVQTGTVKQHERVGRRLGGVAEMVARRDHPRLGALTVMHVPRRSGDDGRVLVPQILLHGKDGGSGGEQRAPRKKSDGWLLVHGHCQAL